MQKGSIGFYVFVIAVIGIATYVSNQFKQSFANEHQKDDYEMVKQYLLNDSPLYGYNRPKIWIHSQYEVNARTWKNFMSRNSTDLNQPYLYLTIQSIINHCSKDFHVCLIDDESFSKLIPNWDVSMNMLPEPQKSKFRKIGMLQLLYFYGGMVLPNSFLCTQNMRSFYDQSTKNDKMFVAENVNKHTNMLNEKPKSVFVPDTQIMGTTKNNDMLKSWIEFLRSDVSNGHFSQEMDFLGSENSMLQKLVTQQQIHLISGDHFGVKTRNGSPIILDDLMEENFLDVDMSQLLGIQIPRDELLKRNKYQWFSILPYKDVLNANVILSKFFKASMVDSSSYFSSGEEKSILAI